MTSGQREGGGSWVSCPLARLMAGGGFPVSRDAPLLPAGSPPAGAPGARLNGWRAGRRQPLTASRPGSARVFRQRPKPPAARRSPRVGFTRRRRTLCPGLGGDAAAALTLHEGGRRRPGRPR